MKKLLFVLAALILSGCGNQPVGSLSVEAVEEMKNKGVVLIDIRRQEQWQDTGVIPGSHLVTVFDIHNRFSPSTFDQIAQIAGGRDKPIVLLSQTGRRSASALKIMTTQLGFSEVYHAASGISGWQMQKLPLVKPEENH